jgi:hypothetical protein
MVFQQQKGKGETSAGRSCFVDENDDEMADWSVLGVGRNEKVLNDGVFSIGKKVNSAHGVFWEWCFSIVKISSAAQRCFNIVKACLFEVKSASPSGCALIGIL